MSFVKNAQNAAQAIFCKKSTVHNFFLVKSSQNLIYSAIKKPAQSWQTSNKRKFAQSGHPAPVQYSIFGSLFSHLKPLRCSR
jgi:hypothetical protein